MAHSQRGIRDEKIMPEVMQGVMKLKDKHTIIKLKEEGHSSREVARVTGIHRKTVARYWAEHVTRLEALEQSDDIRALQESIVSAPKYDTSSRAPRKYTDEIDNMLDRILCDESAKDATLGVNHKQKLSNVQILGLVKVAGHDIGLTVLSGHIREKRERIKEAFIRQEYEFGQRLEYDFGEVRLVIGGIKGTYHMAVLSSPRAEFRWAYLYTSQKKESFLDSHVRFFEMARGVYDEIVYDNMKNVVTRFIGRNERQLNEDLLKMSIYYGFAINVTNCFSGNEKGHVEGSVKIIRNKVFAPCYCFDSFEDAEAHLLKELEKMNAKSCFDEERSHLRPARPPLELAQISEHRVDKYSFVRVDNNFYSVPDYLVGRNVIIKAYPKQIEVYSCGNKVWSHKRKEGFREMTVEIIHYLDTFLRKPGALKNSVALKSKVELKNVFDQYFIGREREFITIIMENRDKEISKIVSIVREAGNKDDPAGNSDMEDRVLKCTTSQITALSDAFCIGGYGHVN
jgi:transposase